LSQYSGAVTTTYAYDGNGFRVSKSGPTATTVYVFSGSKLIAEYSGSSSPLSLVREYVYFGDQLIGTYDGAAHLKLSDHLSARATTDSNGIITAETGHYPYGELWYSTAVSDEQQFTSFQRDSESGMCPVSCGNWSGVAFSRA
jgi:hypothetical protein